VYFYIHYLLTINTKKEKLIHLDVQELEYLEYLNYLKYIKLFRRDKNFKKKLGGDNMFNYDKKSINVFFSLFFFHIIFMKIELFEFGNQFPEL